MAADKFQLKHSVLEKIIELTHQVFFIYDPESGHMIHINQAFEQVWSRRLSPIIDNPSHLLSTVHPEDRSYVFEQYQRLLKDKENKNIEFRIILPDDSLKWICLSAFLMDQEGISVITGIAEDISKIKEYNFNLMKFNTKKNSILEILSHDLSGPFATIQGIADLVQNKSRKADTADIDELLQIIYDTSKRGLRLIREFVNQESLEAAQV